MTTSVYTIESIRAGMLKTGLNEHETAAFQAHSQYLSRGVVRPTLMQFALAAGTALS